MNLHPRDVLPVKAAPLCSLSSFLVPLLLLTLAFSLSSCARKNCSPKSASLAADKENTSQNCGRIPATQRPYTIDNITYYPIPSAYGFKEHGKASWYGPNFHGKKTSNGETYDMYAMTAAHKTLPMDTRLLVKNLDNGKQTVVRVNDRGPFVEGRVLDLSLSAARSLDLVEDGTARVQIVALAENEQPPPASPVKRQEPVSDTASNQFFVQLGSFPEKSMAARVDNRFRAAGHNSFIRQQEQNGATIFKVFVYVGKDPEKARSAAAKLVDLGYKEALIVSR